MSAILSFIWILYLKQQTNILWCFCSLRFESSLFNNNLFRCLFLSKRIAYIAEKEQVKYFLQNELVKMTFFYVHTGSWFAATAINYVLLSLCSLAKDFFTIQGAAGSWSLLLYERPPHQIEYII